MLADCTEMLALGKKGKNSKSSGESCQEWSQGGGRCQPVFTNVCFLIVLFFCFFSYSQIQRCSNPHYIVKLVSNWPREMALWWQRRRARARDRETERESERECESERERKRERERERALPARASEVNGAVSLLTVKSWAVLIQRLSFLFFGLTPKGKQEIISSKHEPQLSKCFIQSFTKIIFEPKLMYAVAQ